MSCTHDCGCSQTVKDPRTDDWGQIAPESAREATQEPRTASDGTPAAPDACAPVSGPLPRQIKPEDVRPGMVIEQRKGEGLLRDRVIAIEDGTFKGDVVWLHGEDGRNGWSLWLVEDTPAMSRLEEIKARADAATEGPWIAKEGFTSDPMIEVYCQTVFINPDLDGDPIQPEAWADAEFIAAAREDVPWLVSEIERLTAERDALAQIKRHIDEVRNGTGWTVQIYGVLLQQCDQYGKTIDTRRAERAEAERDALAAQVARVEALAEEWDGDDSCDNRTCVPHRSASALRAALAGSETDTGAEEAGHRCEPYYSRSECGQCGWQEQWCVTCSRQMCGCATDTTDQDAMGADQ